MGRNSQPPAPQEIDRSGDEGRENGVALSVSDRERAIESSQEKKEKKMAIDQQQVR